MSLDHLMAFLNKPNEFKYSSHDEKHQAVFITALSLHSDLISCPWEQVEAVAKVKALVVFLYQFIPYIIMQR